MIRYDNASCAVAEKNSQTPREVLVSGSNGQVRILSRQDQIAPVNAGACIVYSFQTLPDQVGRASFGDFDSLTEELSKDVDAQRMLAEGRQWTAETFYGDDPSTLTTLRLAAGLSQRQLGQACGLNQPHISRSEAGRHEPGIALAAVMAKALNVSLDVFAEAWQNTRKRFEAGATK